MLTKAERQENSRQAEEAKRKRDSEPFDSVNPIDELASICEGLAEILCLLIPEDDENAIRLHKILSDRIFEFRYVTIPNL